MDSLPRNRPSVHRSGAPTLVASVEKTEARCHPSERDHPSEETRWGFPSRMDPTGHIVQPRDQSSLRIVPMPRLLVNNELLLLPNRSR